MIRWILNLYQSRHVAQVEFTLATRNLRPTETADYMSLTIGDSETTVVFGYYSDYNSFCHKYLHGRVWYVVNDFANLPYDLWQMAQSRIRE